MKVRKILESRIDINNINDIICSDYDKNILQILKNKYENRCFKSVYILEITNIIARSSLHCKNKVLDGTVYLDVTFEVVGIVYDKGDIIHNCKIVQINNNYIMHAKSQYASLRINNITKVDIFKENDEIPVIVSMARYNIYDNEIPIIAVPLIPLTKKIILYNITEPLTNQNSILEEFDIDNLKTSIKAVEKHKQNKKIYEFFKDLLYPLKKVEKIYGTQKEISIDNLLNIQENDTYYTGYRYLDNNTYSQIDENDVEKIKKDYEETAIVNISKKEFILNTLHEYMRDLNIFTEFLETYDTIEKINSKTIIWKLYKTFKK